MGKPKGPLIGFATEVEEGGGTKALLIHKINKKETRYIK
jgi:hypothetical protein